MSTDLQGGGRVALITGGACGLGWAVARRLGTAGYRVFLVDRDAEGARAKTQSLEDAGVEARFAAADVADGAAVSEAFAAAQRAWQGVDFVVSCAGILGKPALIEDAEEAEIERVLDVDLKGAFWVCKHAVRALRERGGGGILNVGSITAGAGSAYYPAYSAAKAGLVALTASIARHCGRFNIRINCLSPGSIAGTELTSRSRGAEPTPEERQREAAALARKIPLGRPGRPEDIANLVLFLASPLASHIHGAVLTIDGGESLGFH
jgi:NAD(P)-dependent dehydrogenase (short-subunit alcohol dehydrogenase family)